MMNIQHRTSNIEHPSLLRWMFDVGCWMFDVRIHSMLPRCLLALFLAAGLGCTETAPDPGSFVLEIGSHGYTSGRFHRPRGLVYLPSDDTLVVVDWSGRIQKFTLDGRFRALRGRKLPACPQSSNWRIPGDSRVTAKHKTPNYPVKWGLGQ